MSEAQDICMLHDLTDLLIVEFIQKRYKDGITYVSELHFYAVDVLLPQNHNDRLDLGNH